MKKDTIEIGSRVKVLECEMDIPEHIGQIGKITHIFEDGTYEVYCKKDSCLLATKVRLIKAKKNNYKQAINEAFGYPLKQLEKFTIKSTKKKERCVCGKHYVDKIPPAHVCKTWTTCKCKEFPNSHIHAKPTKKKVSKIKEIYAFPHCEAIGCMECLNEADEEMERKEKTPTKKEVHHTRNGKIVVLTKTQHKQEHKKQILKREYQEAKMEWEKADKEDDEAHQQMKRVGYTNFFSFIWLFIKLNRTAKRYGGKVKYEVILPIKWL